MKNCYVYAYYDLMDPGNYDLNGFKLKYKPLYIGKGTGYRLLHGINAVLMDKITDTNKRLFQVLKERKNGGEDITKYVTIIKNNMTSEEALSLEDELIKKFGRLKIDENGILTNFALGGAVPDTTGLSPPVKGKKAKDFYSPEKYENIMKVLRRPKSLEQKTKMLKTRRENGSYYTGNNHAMAKKFIIINPHGFIFETNGDLKKFCVEMSLSWQMLYNNMNSGPVLLDRNKHRNLKRLTNRFWNTLGWQMYSD